MSQPGDPPISPAQDAPNHEPTSGQGVPDGSFSVVSQIDYQALTRFLLEPLVDHPEDLHISCEATAHDMKVWLRVSLGRSDRGRTFGRGGRNIRAIRAVLRAAGQNVGQSVSLEVLGGEGETSSNRTKPKPRPAGSPRPSFKEPSKAPPSKPAPKPKPKLKSSPDSD
jgi:uncharacterized protein